MSGEFDSDEFFAVPRNSGTVGGHGAGLAKNINLAHVVNIERPGARTFDLAAIFGNVLYFDQKCLVPTNKQGVALLQVT